MIPQASSRGRERARLAKPARSRRCAKAAAVTREVCRRCELFRASRQGSPLALNRGDAADVPSKGSGPASTRVKMRAAGLSGKARACSPPANFSTKQQQTLQLGTLAKDEPAGLDTKPCLRQYHLGLPLDRRLDDFAPFRIEGRQARHLDGVARPRDGRGWGRPPFSR